MGNTMNCTGKAPRSEEELAPRSEKAWGDNVEFIKVDVGAGVRLHVGFIGRQEKKDGQVDGKAKDPAEISAI